MLTKTTSPPTKLAVFDSGKRIAVMSGANVIDIYSIDDADAASPFATNLLHTETFEKDVTDLVAVPGASFFAVLAGGIAYTLSASKMKKMELQGASDISAIACALDGSILCGTSNGNILRYSQQGSLLQKNSIRIGHSTRDPFGAFFLTFPSSSPHFVW